MTDVADLSAEAIAVRHLRETGLTFFEIADLTGIPRDLCRQLVHGPWWPKLVTRIEENGKATLVRYP